LARSGVDGSAAEGEDEDEEEDEEGEGEGTAKAWVKAVFLDENKEEWMFQRTWVLLIYVPTRLSDRNKGFLLPVPQNTN